MRSEIFQAYVEQMLTPALSAGDGVALNNLSAHKMAGAAEAIRTDGAKLLYLPPYNPDLNLIEQLFSKLKAQLRKTRACTKEALCATIAELLGVSSSEEFHNYIRNCGYGFAQIESALGA